MQVGDVSKPPNSLMEASSRRIVELQARREDDRKATQRLVVKKFMDATALAFEEQNPRYASDENVSELLHQDIVLITYDKMKFFGKKTVQKKINTGGESSHNDSFLLTEFLVMVQAWGDAHRLKSVL